MISQHNGVALHPPPIDMTIETDASTKGWGAVCKDTKEVEVEHQRNQLPYQLPGTERGISGNSGFCQGRSPNTKAFETVDRQHDRGSVHQQERRYAISTTSDSSTGDLDILSITPDMDHSKASSRFNEFRSVLCIPKFQQSHRVDVRSHYILTNYNSIILHSGSGPLRDALEPPDSPVCSTLSRSRNSGD